MKSELSLKGHPRIVTGTCETTKTPGGQVSVTLDTYDENDVIQNRLSVQVVGEYPQEGDKGLILFPGQKIDDGYWLGTVSSRFTTDKYSTKKDHKMLLPKGVKGSVSNDGLNKIITSETDSRMTSQNSSLILNNESLVINSNNRFDLRLDDKQFYVSTIDNNINVSHFLISKNQINLINNGDILIKSRNNLNLKTSGNVLIEGSTSESCQLFSVKSNKIGLDAGAGAILINGSSLSIKLGSGTFGNSGGIPGLGPWTTSSIEVVQGDMDFSVGVGNITIRALSPSHSVKMVNGFSILGPQSYVEAGILKAEMGAEIIPFVKTTIACTRLGDIKASAVKNIDMSSGLGSISMMGSTGINLDTPMNIKMSALLKLQISALIKTELTTALLDLRNTNVINTGPKVGTPGPGPLCSMPMCPITGCVLTASVAVG